MTRVLTTLQHYKQLSACARSWRHSFFYHNFTFLEYGIRVGINTVSVSKMKTVIVFLSLLWYTHALSFLLLHKTSLIPNSCSSSYKCRAIPTKIFSASIGALAAKTIEHKEHAYLPSLDHACSKYIYRTHQLTLFEEECSCSSSCKCPEKGTSSCDCETCFCSNSGCSKK